MLTHKNFPALQRRAEFGTKIFWFFYTTTQWLFIHAVFPQFTKWHFEHICTYSRQMNFFSHKKKIVYSISCYTWASVYTTAKLPLHFLQTGQWFQTWGLDTSVSKMLWYGQFKALELFYDISTTQRSYKDWSIYAPLFTAVWWETSGNYTDAMILHNAASRLRNML